MGSIRISYVDAAGREKLMAQIPEEAIGPKAFGLHLPWARLQTLVIHLLMEAQK